MTPVEPLLALAVVGLIGALLLVPLGLPGLWIMIGILTAATIAREVSPFTLVLLVGVAVGAELLEWVVLKRTSARFGASRKAFWGAVVGGFVGVLVGMPVPVVGSLLAGLLGTLVGAAVVSFLETRKARHAGRVAWGALLGRAFAAAVKTAAGV